MKEVNLSELTAATIAFVKKFNIDGDSSHSINTASELTNLLAGTGANDISELIQTRVISEEENSLLSTIKNGDKDTAMEVFNKATDIVSQRYKRINSQLSNNVNGISAYNTSISRIAADINEIEDSERLNYRLSELLNLLKENSRTMTELNKTFEVATGHSNKFVDTNITLNNNYVNNLDDMISNGDIEQAKTLAIVISKQYAEQSEQIKQLSEQFKYGAEYDARNLKAFAEICNMSGEGSGNTLPMEYPSIIARKAYFDAAKSILGNSSSNTSGIDNSPKVTVNGNEYEVGKKYQEQGADGKPRIISYDRLGNKWDISHGGVKVND